MAKTIKGPGIYLAQFAGDAAPFDSWDAITQWAAGHGFKGVQLPSWDARLIDLEKAAGSKTYCDELKGVAANHGLVITELSSHITGQLVAVHPAYDTLSDGFAPKEVHGNPKARQKWAVKTLLNPSLSPERGPTRWPLTVRGGPVTTCQPPAGLIRMISETGVDSSLYQPLDPT